jgi:hypothetical protein
MGTGYPVLRVTNQVLNLNPGLSLLWPPHDRIRGGRYISGSSKRRNHGRHAYDSLFTSALITFRAKPRSQKLASFLVGNQSRDVEAYGLVLTGSCHQRMEVRSRRFLPAHVRLRHVRLATPPPPEAAFAAIAEL